MKLVSFGTDVEFPVKNNSGKIIPLSPDIIMGTKDNPEPIDDEKFSFIQLDNVLGELTFLPASNGARFKTYCYKANEYLLRYLKVKKLAPVWKSSHIFKPEQLMTTHAGIAGCEPDFPAATNDDPDKYPSITDGLIRVASGHMHFGIDDKLSAEDVIRFVRAADFMIGGPLTIAHSDPERRKYYGQGGRFRFKDYGFEYRTPDNWWFSRHSYLADRIFYVAEEVIELHPDSKVWNNINKYHPALCHAINIGDKPTIAGLLKKVQLPSLHTKKVLSSSQEAYQRGKLRSLKKHAHTNYPYYSSAAVPPHPQIQPQPPQPTDNATTFLQSLSTTSPEAPLLSEGMEEEYFNSTDEGGL